MTLAAMTAPLANIMFLAILWLLVVFGATLLEDSGARIAAALKGDQPDKLRTRANVRHCRSRSSLERPTPRERRLRAAA